MPEWDKGDLLVQYNAIAKEREARWMAEREPAKPAELTINELEAVQGAGHGKVITNGGDNHNFSSGPLS